MSGSAARVRPFRVLFVCTANVCRSPTAELLLARAVAERGYGHWVETRSAGMRVPAAPSGYCAAMTQLLGDVSERLQAHRPVALDEQQLSRADLVLVAERAHRSAVARMAPSTRGRAFTLREAATLAAALPTRSLPPRPGGAPADRLRWMVGELNRCRGQVPMPSVEPATLGRLWRRREAPAVGEPMLDVPDAHLISDDLHPTVLRVLTESLTPIVAAVTWAVSS